MTFDHQILPISQRPGRIAQSQKKPDEMTIRELREQIKILDNNAVDTNKMKVEMYNRFAMPLASLVCALVGAPLGLQKQRGSSSIAIMTLSNAMGSGGRIPPYVAAFLPDIITGFAGVCLIYKKSG